MLVIMLGASCALASPRLTFEGALADAEGRPAEGPVALTFSLYADAEGGEALWTETHPEVDVVAGDFYVTLGDLEPLDDVLATAAPRYLGLAVAGDDELLPRNALTDVPRAAAALWAADVTGQHIHPSAVSVGNTPVISADGRWVGPGSAGGGGATDYRYRFTSLVGGLVGFCGLLEDGHAICFGVRPGQPPAVRFSAVATGSAHACGIREGGEVLCWGQARAGETAPPFGQYTRIAAADAVSCGILAEGRRLVCWGTNQTGLLMTPPGRFSDLCVVNNAGNYGCGVVDGTGAVACWGQTAHALAGEGYTQVACAGRTVCGIRADGTLSCDGLDAPPDGEFRQIAAGGLHFCGIKTDGNTVCWGQEDQSGATNFAGGPGLAHVAAAMNKSCGLRQDGTAFCWGGARDFPVTVPEKSAP